MNNKRIKTYIVDAFTDAPFKGNPAGVCVLEQAVDPEKMLLIARELGLSETAFVQKTTQEGYFTIRYFSPKMEIPLCGHATLGASKVIFERLALSKICFKTIQDIELNIEEEAGVITMEFPVYDTVDALVPPALLEALGLKTIVNSTYNKETKILLLEIAKDTILKNITPDFEALYRSHDAINGVLITAPSSDPNFDFQSRYFWPWSGTNEDPATGGTHTFLTKYWAERLGKQKLKSFQCSERTGFMEVELLSNDKLLIKSQASIVLEGYLRI